ncbi:hypothetical protein CFP56_039351 [Quercus suber]|uniref:Uncharacterized protein n=1 Tax=Quercus suber TaxID=58331 RepID=A0AAW0LKS6_QUESU
MRHVQQSKSNIKLKSLLATVFRTDGRSTVCSDGENRKDHQAINLYLSKRFSVLHHHPSSSYVTFLISVLLSQAVLPTSLPSLIIHAHFKSLFHAAGFSSPSLLDSLINLNLSQTMFNYILSLPFILTSLVISKASIIQALNDRQTSLPPPFPSFILLYKPLLITHLWNLIINITINMAAFNAIKAFGFLSNDPIFSLVARIVLYTILTNIVVVCNLALVVTGMGKCTGYLAIHKAFLLRRGTNSMALLLALPLSFGLAAIEALFRFRIVRAYQLYGRSTVSMALEGLFIACLYSLLIILDTIACCLLFKSCRSDLSMDEADEYNHIEFQKQESKHSPPVLRNLEELL